MKKIKSKLDAWLKKTNSRWQALSLEKQHKYVLIFFASYLMLSLGLTAKVWYDVQQPRHRMAIEHISNPIIFKKDSVTTVKDSISKIVEKKIYELTR